MLGGAEMFSESFGRLSSAKGNGVLVFHGLGANSHLSGDDRAPGWWQDVVGPGLGLDTDRFCVIAPNVLGGCAGSTGPGSIDPDGRRWAARFPALTIRDQVAAAAQLRRELGIERWAAVIGVSFGGMHAMEWHVSLGDMADLVAVIAAPWVTTAEQIAANSLQIDVVRADPDYRHGDYRQLGTAPIRGLALARRIGMLQYRAPDDFDRRFGRAQQDHGGGQFAVESYFASNAEKFAESFDANSFITLVNAKNSHDIGRGRGGARAALTAATHPLLVVGIDSDRLFPLDQQRFIARHSPGSVSGREPVVHSGGHGHDAFLIDQQWFGEVLGRHLC
ncbi:homoserine O-acetyltransferase [Gordonia polyisoprenivorans]|nr:homoserine O-acetyltransferase [Gordonia polyisoprenivorans]